MYPEALKKKKAKGDAPKGKEIALPPSGIESPFSKKSSKRTSIRLRRKKFALSRMRHQASLDKLTPKGGNLRKNELTIGRRRTPSSAKLLPRDRKLDA